MTETIQDVADRIRKFALEHNLVPPKELEFMLTVSDSDWDVEDIDAEEVVKRNEQWFREVILNDKDGMRDFLFDKEVR